MSRSVTTENLLKLIGSCKQYALSAKVVLRVLSNKDTLGKGSVRDRITPFMAALDVIILRIPEDPPASMVNELDRIITTLRTAEQAAVDNSMQSAIYALDLAGARIKRFARVVEEYDPPENS